MPRFSFVSCVWMMTSMRLVYFHTRVLHHQQIKKAHVLNVNLGMCFSGGWMSLHIPRASENGITSVPPEELPSVWWRDNQRIHPSNTQRIGILAQQKHYTQVQISPPFQSVMGAAAVVHHFEGKCFKDLGKKRFILNDAYDTTWQWFPVMFAGYLHWLDLK